MKALKVSFLSIDEWKYLKFRHTYKFHNDDDRSRSDTVMSRMNFNSLVIFFTIPVLLCFVFEDKTFCTIRVWAVFVFCYRIWACNLTERETLSNSVCPFCFLFEDFRLCSSFSKVNHGAWHVYKPWFGSSVATCRLACSEISLSTMEKKLERSPGKVGHSTIWQMTWQL